jgi:thioredoxin reductase (NADPH)
VASNDVHELIVIGGGPAGYTAALYAARANLEPLVIEGFQWGGQLMLTSDVENYPGFPEGITGPELMEAFRAQAERFGANVQFVDATKVDFKSRPLKVWADAEEYEAETVIVATGASARWLNVPGEERLRSRGVSTCATCDGAFFKERRITVIGGGDSAMEEALFLTRFGTHVTVIHRRDGLRASKIMATRALDHPKISFIWDSAVEEVLGEEKVTGLAIKNLKTGARSVHETDAMFIAVGHDPNTGIFKDQLELDAKGYIASPDGVHTNLDGVFVAGDVWDIRYKQAVTAAGMGCRAAMEAERYLEAIEMPAGEGEKMLPA